MISRTGAPSLAGDQRTGHRALDHVAFVVENIEAAAETWAAIYGVGPFVLRDHIVFDELSSPLGEIMLDLSTASAAWGDSQIELLQVHHARPDRILVALGGPARFSHVSYAIHEPLAESERLMTLGLPKLLEAKLGPIHIIFHEVPGHSHLIELHRASEARDRANRELHRLAAAWDGEQVVCRPGPS